MRGGCRARVAIATPQPEVNPAMAPEQSLPGYEPDFDVVALSYATRLILSELDRTLVVERALEALADFTASPCAALYLLDDSEEKVTLEGCHGGPPELEPGDQAWPLEGAARRVVESKQVGRYGLELRRGLPWPVEGRGRGSCLAAPLVATDNRVIGLVACRMEEDRPLPAAAALPLGILLTVTAVALETARLFQMAVRDSLTGLYVRRYFDHRLAEEEARLRRYGGVVSLLMADVDHFKRINDTHGHQQGDVVLREVARLMRQAVRKEVDVVCRYGGEEFVVLLPHTPLSGAQVVAERIRRQVEQHRFSGGKGPLQITISLGVAAMDDTTLISGEDLVRRADQALYRAKDSGRNRVEVER